MNKKLLKNKYLMVGLLIAMLTSLLCLIYYNYAEKTKTITSNNSLTKGEKSHITSNNNPVTQKNQVNTTSLTAPTGNFVSNHKPRISGDILQQQEESVCNTSLVAQCYIEFTSGSTTKQLQSQTTDKNGSVYWSWNINQLGLSAGELKITAVSSLDGQTEKANDSLSLSVQP